MNENRIDCVGRTQQSYGLNGDWNSEFGNCSSQYFDVRQASNMGTCNQPLAMASGGGVEQEPHIGQNKSSSSIISRFKSPASAFYATEMCMGGFPQYDSQIGNPSLMSHSSKFNDMEFPLYQSLRQSLFMPSLANQPPPKFDLSNPLQEMLKFHLNSDQCVRSPEDSNKIPYGDFPGSNFLPIEQHKFFIDDAISTGISPSIPSKGNQDQSVSFFANHIFNFVRCSFLDWLMLLLHPLCRFLVAHSIYLLHSLASLLSKRCFLQQVACQLLLEILIQMDQ